MRWQLLLALSCCLSCWLGCSPATKLDGDLRAVSDSGGAVAEVRFEGGVQRGDNELLVTVEALASDAPDPQLVAAEAIMASHGHRATAFRITDENGVYRASRLNLYMSGRWQVELDLDLEAGRTSDRVTFAVDVP